jgi:hypothetical protein
MSVPVRMKKPADRVGGRFAGIGEVGRGQTDLLRRFTGSNAPPRSFGLQRRRDGANENIMMQL